MDQRAIDLLPTAQRRLDAQATLGEILGHLGLPAGEVAVDEHSVSHYVYLVQPPVDGVAKVGMGTSDRLRRWAAASWEVLAYWDTGSQERSREIEATALTLLRRAGAMDTPRLVRLRAAFRGFDGVTEWFDTTVAQVQITLDDGHWHVVVEPPVDPS